MSEQKYLTIQEIQKRLQEIAKKSVGENVSLDDNLLDLGVDSLDAMDFILRLQNEFHIKIPNEDEKEMYPGFESCMQSIGARQNYATLRDISWYIRGKLKYEQETGPLETQPATAA